MKTRRNLGAEWGTKLASPEIMREKLWVARLFSVNFCRCCFGSLGRVWKAKKPHFYFNFYTQFTSISFGMHAMRMDSLHDSKVEGRKQSDCDCVSVKSRFSQLCLAVLQNQPFAHDISLRYELSSIKRNSRRCVARLMQSIVNHKVVPSNCTFLRRWAQLEVESEAEKHNRTSKKLLLRGRSYVLVVRAGEWKFWKAVWAYMAVNAVIAIKTLEKFRLFKRSDLVFSAICGSKNALT